MGQIGINDNEREKIEIECYDATVVLTKFYPLSDMLYSGHLVIANTISSDWENHGWTLIENLYLADTHNNGHTFLRLWCNLSVSDISGISLKH